ISKAKLGDDGRITKNNKGEDPTVQHLENRAAFLTGKEDAILVPTGTMANHLAILSICHRGSSILIDKKSHIYHNEKAIFDYHLFGMNPHFFEVTTNNKPDIASISKEIKNKKIELLCLENTHNYYGGICLYENELSEI